MTSALRKLIADAEAHGYPVVHDDYGFRVGQIYVATKSDETFGFAHWIKGSRPLYTIKNVRKALGIGA